MPCARVPLRDAKVSGSPYTRCWVCAEAILSPVVPWDATGCRNAAPLTHTHPPPRGHCRCSGLLVTVDQRHCGPMGRHRLPQRSSTHPHAPLVPPAGAASHARRVQQPGPRHRLPHDGHPRRCRRARTSSRPSLRAGGSGGGGGGGGGAACAACCCGGRAQHAAAQHVRAAGGCERGREGSQGPLKSPRDHTMLRECCCCCCWAQHAAAQHVRAAGGCERGREGSQGPSKSPRDHTMLRECCCCCCWAQHAAAQHVRAAGGCESGREGSQGPSKSPRDHTMLRERTWWVSTGGGNALAFKPSPMRPAYHRVMVSRRKRLVVRGLLCRA
jgi:hypothetical protein